MSCYIYKIFFADRIRASDANFVRFSVEIASRQLISRHKSNVARVCRILKTTAIQNGIHSSSVPLTILQSDRQQEMGQRVGEGREFAVAGV